MSTLLGVLRKRNRDDRGAVAIIVALSIALLVVASTLVLDFGLVRADRQENKLAADDAVMAGLHAADGGGTDVYTYRGVCGALDFLKANKPELSGLPGFTCTGARHLDRLQAHGPVDVGGLRPDGHVRRHEVLGDDQDAVQGQRRRLPGGGLRVSLLRRQRHVGLRPDRRDHQAVQEAHRGEHGDLERPRHPGALRRSGGRRSWPGRSGHAAPQANWLSRFSRPDRLPADLVYPRVRRRLHERTFAGRNDPLRLRRQRLRLRLDPDR